MKNSKKTKPIDYRKLAKKKNEEKDIVGFQEVIKALEKFQISCAFSEVWVTVAKHEKKKTISGVLQVIEKGVKFEDEYWSKYYDKKNDTWSIIPLMQETMKKTLEQLKDKIKQLEKEGSL